MHKLLSPVLLLVLALSLAPHLEAVEAPLDNGLGGLSGPTLGSGPDAPVIQPNPLAGLWALTVGGDFSYQGAQDLASFYPASSLSGPTSRVLPGFYLEVRKHVSETFFGLASLTSLSKSYSVDRGIGQDLYQWDAAIISVGGGWMLYRALNFGLAAQGEFGWMGLTDGSFSRDGIASTKGIFEGSAPATQFSASGLWFILPSVALELKGGYRFARMPLNFTTAVGQVNPAFAPEFYADFSGPYGRAGLSFYWGLHNPWGQSDAPPPPREGPPAE